MARPRARPAADPLARWFEGAVRCLETGDLEGAERGFRLVLKQDPARPEAHSNLGVVLERRGRPAEAEACYREALRLEPAWLQACLNLGVLLVSGRRFEEAEDLYQTVLVHQPEAPAAWTNLGVLQVCTAREAEAERSFRRALDLDPTYAKARFNLSYLLLRDGRFEEGWPALEARPWSLATDGKVQAPRWRGEALAGRGLLIGTEGGFGDMLQFCRYVPRLKALGAGQVGLVCQPTLKRLLATLAGLDAIYGLEETIPTAGWDLWTLPLSLPGLCGATPPDFSASLPYLAAEPGQVSLWRSRLRPGVLHVGLAWRGNPLFENDAERSLPLAALALLAAIPGIQFVSLQKGVGEAEAAQPPPGLDLLDPAPRIQDFADTAALMEALDLVISVDTAAAHLAGALGRPCWVLLPAFKTDWRWFKEREDSPWYPGSLRLFRQSHGGWEPVIQRVLEALHGLVSRQS
jgi:tetratricopeptide (TPR) repeat protein